MSQIQFDEDFVQPFQLDNGVARGRFIRLGKVVQEVIDGHNYPDPVSSVLAELLSLTALISGIFKFDGNFSLQAKGDGPISLLMSDITSAGELRGFAKFDEIVVAEIQDNWNESPVPTILGEGYLAFTLDQGPETVRHQGIVELKGKTLAQCAHNYFRQSDQFPGSVKLASGKEENGKWVSGGFLLQKLPQKGMVPQSGEAVEPDFEESWTRAIALMDSCEHSEILNENLHAHELLYRLFHQDGIRVFDKIPVRMQCRCSQKRVEDMLRSFPRSEIESLKVNNNVIVTCEFCSKTYRFAAKDVELIYSG